MAGTEASSKRKRKYITSFSNVSPEEAESILGFQLIKFYDSQMPIEQFITTTAPEQLKKKIFERLIDCIISEGFPEPALPLFNELVVTDNVGMILIAMVSYFKLTVAHDDLRLSREKKIIRKDEQFGGNMEFIRIQKINVGKNCYVLVVETKGDSLGKELTQLLLALKSMYDINNDKKLVYGFLTTAIQWQLVTYDGQTWKLSELSTVLLANMRKQEDRWLKNNTQILDVIYSILSSI
ncbi:unnamed protein product [Rotaria sordida]|uniref:Uncharacterized protein n=1 Tax=Rotaria sordida TaxID=392033 RepID=A0A814F511_9BILA|nr:unnamed protein product [Rotaria sordida]CAF1044216.1 unnamed protein product [Rotaria sordida]